MRQFLLLSFLIGCFQLIAQNNNSKFKSIDDLLPTPNEYRLASGAPGPKYWQQKVDYKMNLTLNEDNSSLEGEEIITYHNNSPYELAYLWVQLDQNRFSKESNTYKIKTGKAKNKMTLKQIKLHMQPDYKGGFKIQHIVDAQGKGMTYMINKTMLRIDLPTPLKSKESLEFNIKWSTNVLNTKVTGGRAGYEYFPEDGNSIFQFAQFYPRMCVYDDVNGWQNQQFLDRGEFALEFGDFEVEINVPSDHIVAATGWLQNTETLLTQNQLSRWEEAKKSDVPVVIATEKEAIQREKNKKSDRKTWVFKAESVRDFAWASSRKFIWDAKSLMVGKNKVMAMSFYPKEGNQLWGKFASEAMAHTISSYSKHTVNYPYPVAISVNGGVGGMEYPMIQFSATRPEKDQTYSEQQKNALISLIHHEAGHFFFPMIINSDERKWAWMDEGFDSFVQSITMQEWSRKNGIGRANTSGGTVDFMKSTKANKFPVMTYPDHDPNLGGNAYGKPAVFMNILRETVMGRDLFDYAFKVYCERWALKRPQPADFFRTMEDASGMYLDWYWRGWLYSTDHVDIAISDVKYFTMDSKNPTKNKAENRKKSLEEPTQISNIRSKNSPEKKYDEITPGVVDFYATYDKYKATKEELEDYDEYLESLNKEEKEFLNTEKHLYEISFKNVGGLVMPVIIQFQYEDGTKETKYLPAEIWRFNNQQFEKVFVLDKKVKAFQLDPFHETADADYKNNYFTNPLNKMKIELLKKVEKKEKPNPMQQK